MQSKAQATRRGRAGDNSTKVKPPPAWGPTPFTDDEWEFIGAMERYRRKSGRKFPTCREVLAVAKSLGYRKV